MKSYSTRGCREAKFLIVALFFATFATSGEKGTHKPVNSQEGFLTNTFSIDYESDSLMDNTLEILRERSDLQFSTLDQFKVFHEFSFMNTVDESGVTFLHKIVDDAALDYKAVHYDHGNGISIADVDNDDLLDILFVSQMGGNELWRNTGNGRFENITEMAGVGLQDRVNVTASFADIDNDGDEDLYVTTVRMGNVLFENNGEGIFRDISTQAGLDYNGHSSGAIFFDYDRDGLLDLFLSNVGRYTSNKKGRGGYFIGLADAFSGHMMPHRAERSILYKNLGDNKFSDISGKVKLIDLSWTGDATFTDFNKDGYPDLYVLNMQGDDHYYENQRGVFFVDETNRYFPKTPWGSMGVKSFDYNNDGALDLFITDMHSDMTFTPKHDREKKKSDIDIHDPMWQDGSNNIFGNAFYKNCSNGEFMEVSEDVGAENFWPWGVGSGDVNADGYEDIFITSSMNFPYRYGVNSLLLNNLGEKFLDSEFILGIEPRKNGEFAKEWFTLDCSDPNSRRPPCKDKEGFSTVMGALGSRSSAIFDLENDGDLDIVTNDFNSGPQIFVSDLNNKKQVNYLKIDLVGTKSNSNALGAIVKVYLKSKTLTKYKDGKSGYLSQSQMPLYFGLGEEEKVEKIEIIWPSGQVQSLSKDIPINSVFIVKEKN